MITLPKIKENFKKNFSLSKLTWFQTGGKAEFFYIPSHIEDLKDFLKKVKKIPIHIIGGGSNILIRDGGVSGVVMKLGKGFDFIKFKEDHILCGASVKNINLSKTLANNNIKGYEFLSTIPGTLGGSIFMNAGCFDNEIKNFIKSVFVINRNGKVLELNKESISFSYRSSGIKKNLFIIAAKLKLTSGHALIAKKKIQQLISIRKKTQPIKSLTGGSTFLNPKAKKAWELIQKAGCKKFKVGDAEVSSKHCNFLINKGKATSSDLELLGNKIKRKVFQKFGIKLNWEIKIIGTKK